MEHVLLHVAVDRFCDWTEGVLFDNDRLHGHRSAKAAASNFTVFVPGLQSIRDRMALQSALFRGDLKLEAAFVSDRAHILQGSKGDHVTKVQRALAQLDGASIAVDGAFGPGTAAAVGEFKKKRNILNAEGRIDQIIGKKTMAALDAEMQAQERSGGNVAAGSRVGLVEGASGLGAINHTLFYFSGASENLALHGAPLTGGLKEDLQNEMENIDVKPETSTVFGFGGTTLHLAGVLAANLIAAARDPRGKLIIYGFSSGGINAMTLCRNLRVVGTKVDLLVTVDVTDGSLLTEAPVDPLVPDNVKLNRNYFQRNISRIFPIPRGIRTIGPQTEQIDCTHRPFSSIPRPFGKNKHGQMETMTHFDTINDMRKVLKSK